MYIVHRDVISLNLLIMYNSNSVMTFFINRNTPDQPEFLLFIIIFIFYICRQQNYQQFKAIVVNVKIC